MQRQSSFIATGRGGIPQDPMRKKGSDRPWHDLRPLTTAMSTIQSVSITPPIQPIVEASAIQVDESGSTVLVAAKPIVPLSTTTCGIGTSSIAEQ